MKLKTKFSEKFSVTRIMWVHLKSNKNKMGRIFNFIIFTVLTIILTHTITTITANVVSAKAIFCPNSPPRDGFLVCNGTKTADNMVGTPGQDLMNGFGGNDKMVGKSGHDNMYGGSGNDTIIVTSTSNAHKLRCWI